MTTRRNSWQIWLGAAVAGALLAATAGFVVLRQNCVSGGGHFNWTAVACESEKARPIILQGDIHRV